MSKAVLISIRPKWCELIASGKKTVEVRKTAPKLDTPFKVYIYCTKGEYLWKDKDRVFLDGKYNRIIDNMPEFLLNGRVLGEFVCNRIFVVDFDSVAPFDKYTKAYIDKESCISKAEFIKYTRMRLAYGWHISDLKIYDKPKELSEFKKINRDCWYADLGLAKRDCPECKNKECFVQRPPQSWCYVEELSV